MVIGQDLLSRYHRCIYLVREEKSWENLTMGSSWDHSQHLPIAKPTLSTHCATADRYWTLYIDKVFWKKSLLYTLTVEYEECKKRNYWGSHARTIRSITVRSSRFDSWCWQEFSNLSFSLACVQKFRFTMWFWWVIELFWTSIYLWPSGICGWGWNKEEKGWGKGLARV